MEYPAPRRVRAGSRNGLIEFRRPDAPKEVTIEGWRRFDEKRGARGARTIRYTLRPVEEAGVPVAWVAEISFRIRTHLYIQATAEWREEQDEDGCPESFEGFWLFHLKTKRA